MMYVGVDPGKEGGLCFFDTEPQLLVSFAKITNHEICQLLRDMRQAGDVKALIERVGVGPSMPASGAFKFGKTAGILEGIMAGCEVPYDLVSPVKWQSHYNLVQKGMSRGSYEKKKLNRAKAQALYPALAKRITNHTADALLIARFAWYMEEGGGV